MVDNSINIMTGPGDLERLYKAVSAKTNIGDYERFKSKMQTADDRRRFYDAVGKKGVNLGDYDKYERRLSSDPILSSKNEAIKGATTRVAPTTPPSTPLRMTGEGQTPRSAPTDTTATATDMGTDTTGKLAGNAFAAQNNYGSSDIPQGAIDMTDPTQGIYGYWDPGAKNLDTGEATGEFTNALPEVEVTRMAKTPAYYAGGQNYQSDDGVEVYEPNEDAIKEYGGIDKLMQYMSVQAPYVRVVQDGKVLQEGRAVGNREAMPSEREAILMGEGIRRAWEDDESGVGSKIGDAFHNIALGIGSGGASLVSGAIGIPSWSRDLLTDSFNGIASLAENLTDSDLSSLKIEKGTSFDEAVSKIAMKRIDQVTKDHHTLNNARYGTDDIIDSGRNKGLNAAVQKFALGFGEMIPFTALMMASGGTSGMVGGSALLASQQYHSLDGNDEMSQAAKHINAIVNGVAETGLERIGNKFMLEPLEQAIKSYGKNAAKEVATSGLRKSLGKMYYLTPPMVEVTTELATTWTNNITASLSGEDPDRKWYQGTNDTIVLSLGMSGSMGAGTAAARSIVNSNNRKSAQQLVDQNSVLEELLQDENLSADKRKTYSEMYRNNLDQVNGYIMEELDRKGNLNEEQRQIVSDLEAKRTRMEKLLDDPTVPDGVKHLSIANIENINTEIEGFMKDTVAPSENVSPEVTDKRIEEFRANNPNSELVNPMDELPASVERVMNRVDDGLPVDPTSAKETSDILYAKYKELAAMKKDRDRTLTISEIDGYMSQLDSDITALENMTNEFARPLESPGETQNISNEQQNQTNINVPNKVGVEQPIAPDTQVVEPSEEVTPSISNQPETQANTVKISGSSATNSGKKEDVKPKPIEKTPVKEDPKPQPQTAVGNERYKKGESQVQGREREITVADGTKMKGQYKIVSANDVVASHNEQTFSKSEGYPTTEDGTTINDRDYERDKNAQSEVSKIANNFDGRAIQQTPVVTSDGIVVDGNNRIMSRKLAASQGTDSAYVEALKQEAEMYGVDPSKIDGVENPVLVFQPSEQLPYNTETLSRFNKQDKKEKSAAGKAVELSKTLTARAKSQIASIYEGAERPSDVTSDPKKASELIKILIDNNILQSNEVPRYFDVDKGVMTKEGVSLMENIALGSALSEQSINTLSLPGMGDVRNKILQSLVGLINNAKLGSDSLLNEIGKAIELVHQLKTSKLSIDEYINQPDMFGEKHIPDIVEYAVSLVFNKGSFKNWLNSYNNEVGTPDMFKTDGDPIRTKQDIAHETVIREKGQIPSGIRVDGPGTTKSVSESSGTTKSEQKSEGKSDGAGTGISTRSNEEQRGSDGIYSQEQDYANRLGERIRETEAKLARPLTRHEREDVERKVAFEFAKEKDVWVDDLYSLGDESLRGGNENTLVLDKKNRAVYKSNNLSNSQNSIDQFFESIDGHNAVFPENKYTFVGFTGLENKGKTPYVEPIVKQDYIPDAEQSTQSEIDSLMESKGFEKVNDHTFKNDEYTISDLRPRNVLKDAEGNIHVIDDIVTRNKKAKGITETSQSSSSKTEKPKPTGIFEQAKGGSSSTTQQDRKSNLVDQRIPVEKRSFDSAQDGNRRPRKLNEIIGDFAKKLKSTTIYSRGRRRGVLGSYRSSDTLVRITRRGDLDTVAHEMGHLLDDRLDILGNIPSADRSAIEKELKWYADRGGSNPSASMTAAQKKEYLQREGLAEYVRARIVNPSEAKSRSPKLDAYFESHVDAETKKLLQDFSDEFIGWANATHGEQIQSNIEELDPKDKKGFKAWLNKQFPKKDGGFQVDFWDNVKARFTDSMSIPKKAFRFATQTLGDGKPLPMSQNFDVLSRVFAGVGGKLNRIFNNGLVNADNEVLKDADGQPMTVNWLIEGLDTSSKEALEQDMRDVISLLVAERTVEYAKKFGRKDNLTGIGAGVRKDIEVAEGFLKEYEDSKTQDPGRHDRIREAADRYRDYADAGLRYAVDKGRISKDEYQAIKDSNEFYVAMTRVQETAPLEEQLGYINKSASGQVASVKQVLHKAKGGTAMIQNPYQNLLMNTANLIREADRNEVMVSFIEPLMKQRAMGDGDPKNFSQIGRRLEGTGNKHTKTIFVDGEKQVWQFDKDIFEAMSGLEGFTNGPIMEILSAPAKLIRGTVTNFPVFAARNLTRDTIARMIHTRTNSGIKELFVGDKVNEVFELYGGSQAGFHLIDKVDYAKRMNQAVDELTKKGGWVLDPRRLAKGYMHFLESAENVNRKAEFASAYRKAKSEGMDERDAMLYAAYQARDLMDFAVAGTWIREINKVIPFTNAAVQGMVRTAKSVKDNPMGFAYRTFLYTVIPTLISRAVVSGMGDDEEYQELPDYQRDLFWNFKVPGVNSWISIPKPFELGLLSSLVDRSIDAFLFGKDNAYKGLNNAAFDAAFPFDKSALFGPAKPLIEAMVNKDVFRDRAIVPFYEEGKELSLRKGADKASRIGKAFSKAYGFLPGDDEIDPRKIDHVIKGYTTYFGDWTVALSDLGREDSRNKISVSKTGFMRERPISNAKSVTEFYKVAEKKGRMQSAEVKYIREMIQQYYGSSSEAEREKIAKQIWEKSKEFTERFERLGGKG